MNKYIVKAEKDPKNIKYYDVLFNLFFNDLIELYANDKLFFVEETNYFL
jgi:hypothetical protein